jgi:hypothetical protein
MGSLSNNKQKTNKKQINQEIKQTTRPEPYNLYFKQQKVVCLSKRAVATAYTTGGWE